MKTKHTQPLRAAFYTLGCKVNSYDTQALEERFAAAGYAVVPFEEAADVYVINTCTVTHFGDSKSRQLLRRARRRNPDAVIIAAGCYAQTAPEEVLALPEVDAVIGTKARGRIVALAAELLESRDKRDAVAAFDSEETYEPLAISRTDGHTRAYVKVQEGCRQFCTYCIVPYARGPLRSRSVEDTVAEVRRLVRAGYQEIVLTGIHIASWQQDGKSLIDLIEAVCAVPGLRRLRLSSLEPRLVTEDFLTRAAALPAFCPHFHLSLQSGAEQTLRRMGRRYSPAEYAGIVADIRRIFPDAAVTTDVIVGFPGETDADFNESLKFCQDIGFAKIHVFRYSPRRGTPAADFKNPVDGGVKHERARVFSEMEQASRQAFFRAQDGKDEEVLFERAVSPGVYAGHTTNYIPVEAESDTPLDGLIVPVRLQYKKGAATMKAHLKE